MTRVLTLLVLCTSLTPLVPAAGAIQDEPSPTEAIEKGRAAVREGRAEEALELAESLAVTDAAAADLIAGLAFHRMALDAMNGGGSLVEIQLADARTRLEAALAAAPERFPDGYSALCEVAWYQQDLEAAREAGERAVALSPKDTLAWERLGRVAFSQFVAANGDETRSEEAEAAWQRAYEAFERVAETLREPPDAAEAARLARALWQLGDLLAWKQRFDEADRRYAASLEFDPTGADFAALYRSRGVEAFRNILEQGEARFRERSGEHTSSDATLLWWLGYARYELADYEAAEEALLASLRKWPAFANAWYYIALARYHRQRFAEAIEALREFAVADRAALEATLAQSPDYNRGVLLGMTSWCARHKPPRNLDAAFLAQLRIAIDPQDPIPWNDAGLFWRDAGDELSRAKSPTDVAERTRRYERSLECYEKALALSPDDPALLNDTAVVLHYCLHRDLERARNMYRRAAERAQEELARADLSPDLRELYQTALRDSRNNLARLERKLDGSQEGSDEVGGAGSNRR